MYAITFVNGDAGALAITIDVLLEIPLTFRYSLLASIMLPALKSVRNVVPEPVTVLIASSNVFVENVLIGVALNVEIVVTPNIPPLDEVTVPVIGTYLVMSSVTVISCLTWKSNIVSAYTDIASDACSEIG